MSLKAVDPQTLGSFGNIFIEKYKIKTTKVCVAHPVNAAEGS